MDPDFVNVHDAKTNLLRILERGEAGERVVIARVGKPVADLVAHRPTTLRIGALSGKIRIQDDAFDWPDESIETIVLWHR